NVNTFNKDVESSLRNANFLSSIFRTFRYRAHKSMFRDEKNNYATTGIMGGEGIRGYGYNNYYESGILKDYYNGVLINKAYIKNLLNKYFIKTENIPNDFYEYVIDNEVFNKNENIGQFYFLYKIICPMHHTPDISFIENNKVNVFNPFLDYDYLTTLFSSKYSFNNNTGFLKPHYYNLFYFKIIKNLKPELLDIPLTNSIVPRKYLNYNPLTLVDYFKNKTRKKNNIPVFKYDKWFENYIKYKIDEVNYERFQDILNLDSLKRSIKLNIHKSNESYWHKYVNALTASIIYNHINS
ncbi:MAG: hypothetical protein ACOCV1_08000, partial [Bacillota bacterium]